MITEGFTEAALSSSPEGIRTPDLFLEREAPWTARRPGRAVDKVYRPSVTAKR